MFLYNLLFRFSYCYYTLNKCIQSRNIFIQSINKFLQSNNGIFIIQLILHEMVFYFDLDFALTGAFYFDDTGNVAKGQTGCRHMFC